jgi:DeoR/GlpR family transcriptional regulator of sugar metabolism
MFQKERRQKIIELIQENGNCQVSRLSLLFSVSEQTIRQDLRELEADGMILRQHGGACLKRDDFAFSIRVPNRGHEEEKRQIANIAAEYVESGNTIILDSGSTVSALANELTSKKDLTVITNAINIAITLSQEPTNNVLLIGGEFKGPTLSLTGTRGIPMFDNIHADKLFLATGGFDVTVGLSFPSFSDLELKRAMIHCAREVYLLADSSKIGMVKFASLGCLEDIDVLITDRGIKESDKAMIQAKGIKVVIAS